MMKIYNSLSGKKAEFQPITPGVVKLYVCGQTVYDYCHIGHARSMIVFDMIVRFLRAQHYHVIYVRNITDIDDKIIQRATENDEPYEALTQRFIHYMHADEKQLGLLPVDCEPRATEYLQSIIDLIQLLLNEKMAYIARNGDVCFAVRKFKEYGKLAKRDIEKLIAGARVEINDEKKDPLDFVLWKLSKPHEPKWDSPWGEGRPGWHIECSAMASRLLGQPFDIHGGGMDLKFPHHENEIAQSEGAYHTTFTNVWMHVGLLNVNGEKMSKSLNNFFTIQDVLKKYPAEVIRYFMLSAHYRSPVHYSLENLEQARQALSRLYLSIRGLTLSEVSDVLPEALVAAMEDDFNSSVAFSVMFDMTHEINKFREQNQLPKAEKMASQLKKLGEIFGILQMDPEVFLQGDLQEDFVSRIEKLIADRNAARKNKDYIKADQIRAELQTLNVVIEDSPSGTTWRFC